MPISKRSERGVLMGVLCLGIFLGAEKAAAERLVVVNVSNTDSFSAGAIIDGDQAISLADNAELSLINEAGRKIVIKGPFRGAVSGGKSGVDQDGSSVVDILAKALKKNTDQGSSLALGAIRGSQLKPGDVWSINFNRGGRHCLPPNGVPVVWRPGNATDNRGMLRREGKRTRGTLIWKAGEYNSVWPPNIDVVDGATYVVNDQGGRVKRFTLHRIPRDLPTPIHWAAWMLERKCASQAKRLLAETGADRILGNP